MKKWGFAVLVCLSLSVMSTPGSASAGRRPGATPVTRSRVLKRLASLEGSEKILSHRVTTLNNRSTRQRNVSRRWENSRFVSKAGAASFGFMFNVFFLGMAAAFDDVNMAITTVITVTLPAAVIFFGSNVTKGPAQDASTASADAKTAATLLEEHRLKPLGARIERLNEKLNPPSKSPTL